MKKYWWKEFEDQNQIQVWLRIIKEQHQINKKRVFQVFDSCVFSKDFLVEFFSSEGKLKNLFEVRSLLQLNYNPHWGDLIYSNKTEKLWHNIDLYIKYCNPTEVYKHTILKKLKIVQLVDGYMKINGIPKGKRKGVSLGMRKRLGFYNRVYE